jgi:nitroreductase
VSEDRGTANETMTSPRDRVRPLLRVRQVRDHTEEPVSVAELDAIADVARWSGSARNSQPWRFIVVREADTLRAIADAGMPQTRSFHTATAGIAIVMPSDPVHAVGDAYDEGRAAERILIAASLLGLGAAISWMRSDVRPAIAELLDVPSDRYVRTIVALGHPSAAGQQAKSAPGTARLHREDVVFEERWPTR